MSKTKERGKFYDTIKTVKVRKDGHIISEMSFNRLVNEVADDPSFSVAESKSRRKNPSERARQRNPAKDFAICLSSDDPELLIPLKIYQVEVTETGIRVKEESGDLVDYPEEYFALVSFPQDLERRLKEAQQAA